MKTAVRLFDQRLHVSIREGGINSFYLRSLLSAVTHLNPLEAVDDNEMGFSWISGILNSGYTEEEQYFMASATVRFLSRYCRSHPHRLSFRTQSAWIPPLLKFLSLCESFPIKSSPPCPMLITLRFLLDCPRDADFGTALLPTLTSMLSPDRPHQSRKLALAAFRRFVWHSPMEAVSVHGLNNLLRAVGDPFHFPPESPQDQDGEREIPVHYEPMSAAVILIEFASLELWQSHLHPSNFTSYEDVVSTDEGRRSALREMFEVAFYERPELLCTPTKIVTAIRRLEELGCLNTTQVVITWAWVTGMVDEMDQDGWRLIGDETLRFYRSHGMRSLDSLKRCIIDKNPRRYRTCLVHMRFDGSPFRVGRSRRQPQVTRWMVKEQLQEEWDMDCVISQACQLRSLYHLFGCDPTTWQKAIGVGVGEVDEGREALPEHPVIPDPFMA